MREIMEMEAVDVRELRELRKKARNREYGHNPVLSVMAMQQNMYREFRQELAQIKYENTNSAVIGRKGESIITIEYRLFRRPKIRIDEGGEEIAIL
ncbi:MAG: hypothetical protein ACYDAZ_04020 [Thermoplasmataceae archaeon]